MLTPQQYEKVVDIFTAATRLKPEERDDYIEDRCSDHPQLRDEVTAMLHEHDCGDDLLSDPVLGPDFNVQHEMANVVSPDAQLVGTQLGRFHLNRIIATGGMGTVYEAEQDKPRRTVAVKVMKAGIASKSALRRFEYESQILAKLRHPGIAQVFEAGTCDEANGLPYFVMEYIPDALPVTEHARRENLNTRQRLALFARICDAVHHGHQKGIIHRDLKPANILVDSASETGEPKIIDFGVARATDSDIALTTVQTDVGQLIGTLQYMSPEQCDADPHDLDIRSDVYSLGVVLYELLCDRLPYDVSHHALHEALRLVREAPPTRPSEADRSLRGDLETITLKALEKQRDRRYQSAAELARDLQHYLKNEPILARPPSAMYQLRKFARRHRAAAAAIAAVVVILIGAVIVSSMFAVGQNVARREAVTARQTAEQEQALAEGVYEFMHHTLTAFPPGHHDITLREVLDGAAATIDGEFPDQPLVEAEVRNMIQSMYLTLGDYHLAEPHAREMVAIRQRELGDEDPQTLDAMKLLAVLLRLEGKHAEAESLFRRVLESRLRILGEEHNLTIEAMGELGVALLEESQANEAEPLLRRALVGNRRIFGDEHTETVTSMNNLAMALSMQGKLADAEPLYQSALEIRRRTAGDEDLGTILMINNLAWHYLDMDKPAEAEPLFREAVDLRRRIQSETHPETVLATDNLATALRTLDRFDEAEQLLRQTLETVRDHLENEHPTTLLAMNRLALLLQKSEKAQKLAEAEPLLREVLEIRRRTQGEQHPATATAIQNLAWQCWKQGILEEADELFRESIALHSHIDGEPHSYTINARLNYGTFLLEQERPAEAETQYRIVYDTRMEHLGPDHADTVASQVSLAMALLELERHEEAEMLLRAALSFRRDHFGDEHWLTYNTESLLGGALMGRGDLAAAESLLLGGYEGMKSLHEAPAVRKLEALERIVQLYEHWPKPEMEAEWRDRLAAATESDGEE